MKSQKKSFIASSVKAALYGSTALVASLNAYNVAAQSADESPDTSEVEEVIEVKGIRGALMTAADLKRESSTFVDSITASDANSLPDLSVAEALSRVPGVTVTKFDIGGDGGDFPSAEGSGNLIRGLGLIRSELNGRDAFTADGARALDWSSIPPQMIEGVDVYKNQTADLIEGGIGGSINLRTLEPFDREGLFGVVAVNSTYSDLREEWAPTYSGVISNRFKTDAGEFGFAASFSHSELKSEFNGYQRGAIIPVEVDGDDAPDVTVDSFTDANGGIIPESGQTVGIINGFQLRSTQVDRERDNIYLAGQFRNKDENFTATVKYVRITNEVFDLERTTEWQDGGAAHEQVVRAGGAIGVSDATLRPYTSEGVPRCGNGAVNGGGDLTYPEDHCSDLIPINGGLFEEGIVTSSHRGWAGGNGVEIGNLGIGRRTETETDDISINIDWQVDDNWHVEFDAHRTEAQLQYREQWIGATTHADVYTRPDIDNPQLSYMLNEGFQWASWNTPAGYDNPAPTSFTDPAAYNLSYAADRFRDGEGDSAAARVDLTYEFDNSDWFKSVKFGARRSEREQVWRDAGLNWAEIGQPWAGTYIPYASLDTDAHEAYDFGDFQRGGVFIGEETSLLFASSDFLRNPDLFYDFLQTDSAVTSQNVDYSPFQNGDRIRRDANYNEQYQPDEVSSIVETNTAFYVRLDFETDFDNGMWLEGNIGGRYISVQVESTGSSVYTPLDNASEDGFAQSPSFFLPEAAIFYDQPSEELFSSTEENYFLPSLNLKLNLNDESLIRFGISRGITFPNISDLSVSRNYSAVLTYEPLLDDDGNPVIGQTAGIFHDRTRENTGNPLLKPTEATNIDLSYEWYGEAGNSFSFSIFYKDLENLILTGQTSVSGSNFLDGADVANVVVRPENQESADILGFEVSGQYFFDELPGVWSNFGVQANFTKLDVDAGPPALDLDFDGDGSPDTWEGLQRIPELNGIIGQSENFANLVGIYQDEKLEVRLAYQWRDEFLNSYYTFISGNPNMQKANFQLDASVKYQLTDNIQIHLQGTNLTDELQQSEDIINPNGERTDRSSFMFDRRFFVALQYTF